MTWKRDTVKIWIDDEREPPDYSWQWCVTSDDAIDLLCEYDPEVISFDHDLGKADDGEDDNAMRVVDQIEIWSESGVITKFEWQVHSMNPVGRENIIRAMNRIEEKYWR